MKDSNQKTPSFASDFAKAASDKKATEGKAKLLIFASGSKDGGGSGFEKLVQATREQRGKASPLDAEIVAVVSNHKRGGVRERADRLGIPFIHFVPPKNGTLSVAAGYQRIVRETGAEWVALSGWLKLVKGLDPKQTFNIHPALLSIQNGRFGGDGMYGHHVHEAVKVALDNDEVHESGVTMHFVTPKYDRGPIFFEKHIHLSPGMTADAIGALVNKLEHEWQPQITNMVIHGEISWDGKDPNTLTVPDGYDFLPKP